MRAGLLAAIVGPHRSPGPQYAAAAGPSASLAINPGDIVVVFTNTNSTPSSITDDGGNTYTLLHDGSYAFNCDSYYSIATSAATLVTINGGGAFVCNIAVATFPGASGIGASAINPGSGSVSLTTTKNGSTVVGVVQVVNGSASLPLTSGTQRALSAITPTPTDGRNNRVVLGTTSVPLSGTSTAIAANVSGWSYANALSVEIKY
jgi:hypothetical protein